MSAVPRIETFGCRLNLVESDMIARLADPAVAVVNTCAVTVESVRQARQTIRRLHRECPERPIIVTGCAAETDPAGFAALPGVMRLVPNAAKTDPAQWGARAATPPTPSRTRAFIAVQTGCDHRCTFCIIPFGRGASRSVPAGAVVEAVAAAVANGAQEAVLTGVDLTAWGLDLPGRGRLGWLVRQILRHVPELPRLRLSSLDCIEIDADLRAALAEEPRLMPHLHLSLQAGDDLVLKRMKRRHGRAEALALCAELRRLRPDIVLGADLIAGFPTETDAMAARTHDLVAECGLTYLHVFPFSPRPGTPAARMPLVPAPVARERALRLREAGAAALAAHLASQIGRRLSVLTERGGLGHAEDFSPVRIGDTAPGQILSLVAAGHDGKALLTA